MKTRVRLSSTYRDLIAQFVWWQVVSQAHRPTPAGAILKRRPGPFPLVPVRLSGSREQVYEHRVGRLELHCGRLLRSRPGGCRGSDRRFPGTSIDRSCPLLSMVPPSVADPARTDGGSGPVRSRTPPRSGPPRPGTDRPAGHGKADTSLDQPTTCSQSQMRRTQHLRRCGVAHVGAAWVLSVGVRWGPAMTAVNGRLVARSASRTAVRPGGLWHQLGRRVRLALCNRLGRWQEPGGLAAAWVGGDVILGRLLLAAGPSCGGA